MTQMEKGMNKQEMKDFKDKSNNLNAMVPGMYTDLPLAHQAKMKDPKRFRSLNSSVIRERPGAQYNSENPTAHKNHHQRHAASLINLNTISDAQ